MPLYFPAEATVEKTGRKLRSMHLRRSFHQNMTHIRSRSFFRRLRPGNYVGTVTGSWPTSALGIINISSINVTAKATAVADHDIAFV